MEEVEFYVVVIVVCTMECFVLLGLVLVPL